MKYYILRNGDYYLEDYNTEDVYTDGNIFITTILKDYTIGKEYKKLFYDFEIAEDTRKLIYIETGLNLEVKLFKEEE